MPYSKSLQNEKQFSAVLLVSGVGLYTLVLLHKGVWMSFLSELMALIAKYRVVHRDVYILLSLLFHIELTQVFVFQVNH